MPSSIFSFKAIAAAILTIAVIEGTVMAFSPDREFANDLLVMAPVQKEKITNVLVNEKLNRLRDLNASILFVGDSSTFYGVKPRTVMKALPGQLAINLGCCGVSGFRGYRLIAQAILRTNPDVHELVLGFTPYYPPLKQYEDGLLAESIERSYAGRWWWIAAPSAAFRLRATNLIYEGKFENRFFADRVQKYWDGFDKFWPNVLRLRETLGWMPRPGDASKDLPTGPCVFHDLEPASSKPFGTPKTLLYEALSEFERFARERRMRLWVVTNPVPCDPESSPSAQALNAELERFFAEHPEVEHPIPSFRTWPTSQFLDQWHLAPEGAERNSAEIGQAMHDKMSSSK